MHLGFSTRAAFRTHTQCSPTQSKLSERASGAHSAQGVLRQAAQKESSRKHSLSACAEQERRKNPRRRTHERRASQRERRSRRTSSKCGDSASYIIIIIITRLFFIPRARLGQKRNPTGGASHTDKFKAPQPLWIGSSPLDK
jgi:hypothetical protein